MPKNLVAVESVTQRILLIRGQKVMLDADLAGLFGVPTKVFNQAITRNLARFPADFMFRLTSEEYEALRSQFVTLKTGRGQHRKYLPYVFTEHGAIMTATILNSPKAQEMSVFIVRAFVQLREMLSNNKEVAAKLLELERKVSSHDQAIVGLMDAIRQLMMPPPGKSRPIGFTADIEEKKQMKDGTDKKQRGFSLVSAIFLLVVIAALGTFAVTLSTTQHQSAALDVMGARAYQAARAGIEWGAYQVLQNPAGAFATGCQPGPTTQNIAPLPNTLAGFNVNVGCTSTPHVEAGITVTIYQLTSTATQGTGYVERQLSVAIAQQ